jgi:N6-L-threonylcarbamoyladenine synthase
VFDEAVRGSAQSIFPLRKRPQAAFTPESNIMLVLGIESSCDECAAAVVEDGAKLLSNVVATQIPFHQAYNGVVPEIASRKHIEWISGVVSKALDDAQVQPADIGGVGVTNRPGLLGSLLVGVSFAKAFSWARGLPFIAVNHILAHLYASRLTEEPVGYPFLGLLVSGGHSIICRVDGFDSITVLGASLDDAVGEAFDKVAKFYNLGYPGGVVIDKLAQQGDSGAFKFPLPYIYNKKTGKKDDAHKYDVSYSGLKTAVTAQLEQFRHLNPAEAQKRKNEDRGMADIAASFQKTAVEILLRSLFRAVEDTGLYTVVAGGGVAANSLLRREVAERGSAYKDFRCVFPALNLCGDNGAMVAGLAFQYLKRGDTSSLSTTASARVTGFRKNH